MRAGSNVLARMLVSEMADAFPGESISNLLRCVGEQRVRPYLLGLGLNPLTRVVEVMFAMIIEPSVLPQSFVAALTDGRERQGGAMRTHTLDRLPSMLQGQPWSCGANATLSWAVAHRDWLDSQIEDLTPHTVNHISYTASDGELFSPEEISFFGISPRLSARIDRFQGVFLRSSQDAILQEVARCDLPFGASLLSVIQTPLDPNESDVECNIVSIAVRNDEIVRDPNDCVVMVWNRVARNEESGTDFGGLAGGFRREQQSILRAWMEDIEASANGATPGYRLNRTWPAIEPRGQAVEYQPKNPAFVGRNWANPATIDIRPSSRV